MHFRSLEEINALLKSYIPAVKEITGKNITLQRMIPLMKLLGNPESELKTIHIAGTSGKTSTAYYIASLLSASGRKVGLTVSPHISSIAERVQINLQPLSDNDFCSAFTKFIALIKDADPRPTYFELMVGFAYWYFAQNATDYAVIETGLGGLHDATNVAHRPDKICVITDIGYDHTKVLGKTISSITEQKAGIIYKSNHVFSYKQSAAVMKVLSETCRRQQAELTVLGPKSTDHQANMPLFQIRNWTLAKTVYDFIANRDQLAEPTQTQLAKCRSIIVPARMEAIKRGKQTIIIDGAHNPQKLAALIKSVGHRYPGKSVAVLAGFVKSRKPRLHGNLNQILTIADYLIATEFVPNQEMYTKSADVEAIALYCRQKGLKDAVAEPDTVKALDKLLARPEPILLITGSFYLIGYIRPFIIGKND